MSDSIQLLFVDNKNEYTDIIRNTLELNKNNHTYKLNFVTNLREAREYIENNACDMIISDINLPDGEGIELIKNANGRKYPVLFMTPFDEKSNTIDTIKSMDFDYIIKSEDNLKDIHRHIERAIREWDNIVGRGKAEEALKKNEALYAALFRHIPIQTVVVDRDAKIIEFNNAKITSGDKIPRIGQVMYKEYAASHVIDMYSELMKCMSAGEMAVFPELPYKNKILSIKISPFDEGAIITTQDVTEQKRAEKKVEHLNELLMAIRDVNQLITHETSATKLMNNVCQSLNRSNDHAGVWMAITDSAQIIIKAAKEGNSCNIPDFLGKQVTQLPCAKKALSSNKIFLIDNLSTYCRNCRINSGNRQDGKMIVRLEYNNRLYGILNISVVDDFIKEQDEISLIREVADDIAFGLYNMELEKERKELQKQLYRSARLSAVGQLAAGIAHEFNNLLSVILGHTQLSLEEDSIEDIKNSLYEIEKTTKRGSSIVVKLAAFARPKEPDFKPEDISRVIDDVLLLQKRQLHLDNIKIEKKFQTASRVFIDRGQMEQVFLNLVINSIHAIKPKGRGKIAITVRDQENFQEIRFMDNGIGMEKEIKEKIFDPFFSTKGAWARDSQGISGTGLGLSIAHSIIKQHSGTIVAKSTKDKGTTFIIRIPYELKGKDGKIEEIVPVYAINPADFDRIKDKKILLVDDEEEMVVMFRHFFQKAGFDNVKIENKGENAISIIDEFNPDLVFLDLIMPEMNGEQVFREIRQINPDIPVVFMSGKVDIEKEFYINNGAFDVIQKPFNMSEIFGILARIL